MKNFSQKNAPRCAHKAFKIFSAALAVPAALVFLGSCSKKIDYFDYVSELRSNVLVASKNNLSLAVYATEKETPYAADGIKRETTPRAEIYLTAPTGVESYDISFTYEGKEYGGDMSFDNVKLEYFYSCSLDLSAAAEIVFTVAFDETTAELTAASVRTEETLSPRDILNKVKTAESETFNSMTDRNGLAGEIYMRLIYEDAPYYYVGIIDREGRILALLVDSTEGKILAKRQM